MQIVIDTMQCPCRTLSDECGISHNECHEDDICSSCPLIRNGGVKLPKGHGRLIDADRLLRPDMVRMCYHLKNGDTAMPIVDIEHAETVIPADKEDD